MAMRPTTTRRDWLRQTSCAALAAAGAQLGENSAMAGESRKPRVIDSHVHVWKNDPRYPWPADLKSPPKDDALPETLLALMQQNGVERTVIVHVIYYRWDCRYAAACIRAHPDKFMGVSRINPQSATPAVDLDHWTAAGFHGVRLSPGAGKDGDWINDVRQMDAIWARAAGLKIPMCILCPISRIPDVEQVVERHNERLDVCIDHMADSPIDRPDELNKLLRLARYPRVYVKLSHLWTLSKQKYPYRDTHDQVRRLYDAFGPRRLMWGTDWPAVEERCTYAQALALYRDEIKFLSDDDRRWILGETALRLWPFTKTA
jgi:predicted TIM-barrel fold metal-dependent hydrolase